MITEQQARNEDKKTAERQQQQQKGSLGLNSDSSCASNYDWSGHIQEQTFSPKAKNSLAFGLNHKTSWVHLHPKREKHGVDDDSKPHLMNASSCERAESYRVSESDFSMFP